jgi:hypothetical protein
MAFHINVDMMVTWLFMCLAIELDRHRRKQGKLFYYSNLLKKMVARKKVLSDTKFAAFNPDYVLPYITYLDIQKIRL